MSKPVDLIIANRLHETAERLASVPQALLTVARPEQLSAELARALLCAVSHDAALPLVLKALAVAGAPSTLDEIAQRLQAARDQQRELSEPSTASADPVGAADKSGGTA